MPQIKREDRDNLESFAKRIMTRLKAGGATDSLERIICRHITGKDVKVSAFLTDKVVQWRYGKAKETVEHSGKDGGPIGIVVRHIVGTESTAETK